jgi:hypothetical protein
VVLLIELGVRDEMLRKAIGYKGYISRNSWVSVLGLSVRRTRFNTQTSLYYKTDVY